MAHRKSKLDRTAHLKDKAGSDALLQTTAEAATELSETALNDVAGGRADGSLDAGLHFKYDIKGNKEG